MLNEQICGPVQPSRLCATRRQITHKSYRLVLDHATLSSQSLVKQVGSTLGNAKLLNEDRLLGKTVHSNMAPRYQP